MTDPLSTCSDVSEILSAYGILTDLEPYHEDPAHVLQLVTGCVRQSFEHDPFIIRTILHDAGFDDFEETIIPHPLTPIEERYTVAVVDSKTVDLVEAVTSSSMLSTSIKAVPTPALQIKKWLTSLFSCVSSPSDVKTV